MHKKIYVICFILIFFVDTMRVYAQSGRLLQDGYTEEGIYYQIYDLESDISVYAVDKTIAVSRCLIYEEIIMPSKTIEYTQNNYSGVLILQRFRYKSGKTYAYYSGTLTLQE